MIAIVDYGVGNLFSLLSSLRALDLEAEVTGDAGRLRAADRIILPGVGAFGDARAKLDATGLVPVIQEEAEKKPLLGICLGMQMAVIEFARHVLGWADASSSEFSSTAHPVIDLMPDQVNVTAKGGTMRLGRYPCVLAEGSRSRELYGAAEISERHRHRYEVNNDYRTALTDAGMRLCGMSPDGRIVEMLELPDHPYFLATQAHPEFNSRPNHPHPLFLGLISSAVLYRSEEL